MGRRDCGKAGWWLLLLDMVVGVECRKEGGELAVDALSAAATLAKLRPPTRYAQF